MLESEAKAKWCPMVRMGHYACNTDPQTPMAPFYACRGSDCMMWESEDALEEKKHRMNDPVPDGWYSLGSCQVSPGFITIRRWVPTDSGDCGLKAKK